MWPEYVCVLSSGIKAIFSVSEALASPHCLSAMRVHKGTVVTLGLRWEQGVQRVPMCPPSYPMMAMRRCPCICMSSRSTRTSIASSKVGSAGEQWRPVGKGDEVALLTAGFSRHSDPLQLLLWPQRLQPLPGS